jgi:hypothetical protein
MSDVVHRGFWGRIAPALTLVFLSPMIAEVLPGATRLSAIFVLPVEMGVWGVGALFIRAAVRRWRLGWRNLLLLALALALAEECVIQQTSLAPMVLQIVKGPPYARDFGVNWLYLIWALGYESTLAVILPVMLVELIFPARRESPWLSGAGAAIGTVYFVIASVMAWFSWIHYVRIQIFHMPPYAPPRTAMATALALMALLVLAALGPTKRILARPSRPLPAPSAWSVGAFAFAVAVLWYGLVLLAFAIKPDFPPLAAATVGVAVAMAGLHFFPRWSADARWNDRRSYAAVFGGIGGSMAAGFVGFIGATPFDLYGKIAVDALAFVLLIVLGVKRLQAAPTQDRSEAPSK